MNSNKYLFICNQGKHRSKTAAELFGGTYARVYSQDNPVTKELLADANTVFVMEEAQRKVFGERFPKEYLEKKIINLEIEDIYDYGSKELKNQLKEQMKKVKQ